MKTIGMIIAVEIQSVRSVMEQNWLREKKQQGTRCWNMRRTNIGWSL